MGSFVDAANAITSIGHLVDLVKGSLNQDWSGRVAFTSRAKELHSAMLSIQCMCGGAKTTIRDSYGNVICPANTKVACNLTPAMLTEWRTLRDGFAEFWKRADQQGDFTNAEAQRLKDYATAFYGFYTRAAILCENQGVNLSVPSAGAAANSPERTKDVPIALIGAGVGVFLFVLWRVRKQVTNLSSASLMPVQVRVDFASGVKNERQNRGMCAR